MSPTLRPFGLMLALALVLVLAVGAGCASNYYDTYVDEHPAWHPTTPTEGAGLHEVLAALYAPPSGDYRRFVQKLAVAVREGEGWRELDSGAIEAALREPGDATYLVVATLRCRSEAGLQIYSGEKVSWYLLPEGRLSAWDAHYFAHRCTVVADVRPAAAERAAVEESVVAFRNALFPRSMQHPGEHYLRGLAYVERGRLEDARRSLERGDEVMSVDNRPEGRSRYETPSRSVPHADAEDRRRLRERLVTALEEAEAE